MRTPASLAAVPLLAGAALGVAADPPGRAAGLFWCVSVAAVGSVCARRDGRGVAALLVAAFLLGGWQLGARARVAAIGTPLAGWFARQPGGETGRVGPVALEGRLRRDARPFDGGALLDLEVERVGAGAGWTPAAGGVRLGVGGRLVPAGLDRWRAGRRLRIPATLRTPQAYRNPGRGDEARRQALRGAALVGSVKSALLVEVVNRGGAAAEAAAAIRDSVRRRVAAAVGVHDARSAAIVTAILIGDRAGLDDETTRRLQESGTYHVIAISGGNIAILAGCLLWLGRWLGAPPRVLAGAVMVLLLGYAFVVGREASVARATAAAVLALVAVVLDHRPTVLNVLAATAVGLALAAPLVVVDPGFLLTFGATLGIVLGASRLAGWLGRLAQPDRESLSRLLRAAAALLAATVCAEAALLPVGAALFGRASLAGLLLNFLAIPLMTVTQVAGLAAVGLSVLSATLASAAGHVAHLAAAGLVESTRPVDWCPWLVFRVPPPGPVSLCLYYGALVVLLTRTGGGTLTRGAWLTLAATTVWILLGPPGHGAAGRRPPGWIRVVFLDVGQADATLVQTASGESLLVDAAGTVGGGTRVGERVVVPALWALGVRRLDAAVVTHGDPDHIGGMPQVLRDLRPREVWEGVPVPSHDPLARLRQQAGVTGARWRQVAAGERLALGTLAITVAHPPAPDWERPRVRNDDSVVLDLRHGGVSVLLPGDIGQAVEPVVAGALAPARWRIVKVPHHGSAGSSGQGFVDATRPCLAVVSAGRANSFGHPAPDVVERYRAAGALVLETSTGGAIVVDTDGRVVVVRQTGRPGALAARTDRGCAWEPSDP